MRGWVGGVHGRVVRHGRLHGLVVRQRMASRRSLVRSVHRTELLFGVVLLEEVRCGEASEGRRGLVGRRWRLLTGRLKCWTYLIETNLPLCRISTQLFKSRRSDLPPWYINNSQKGSVIIGVGEQA